MPREDLLTTDREKARAKAEIRHFLTRLAVFAALCWVLFGVVFGLAVVPGSAMAPRLCGGDLVLFSRFERGTAAGQVVLYRQDGTRHLGRIAARGGDIVTVTDTGALIINGSTVAEPDITTPTQLVEGGPDYPVTLAEGELFLLTTLKLVGHELLAVAADQRARYQRPERRQGAASLDLDLDLFAVAALGWLKDQLKLDLARAFPGVGVQQVLDHLLDLVVASFDCAAFEKILKGQVFVYRVSHYFLLFYRLLGCFVVEALNAGPREIG